MSSIPVPDEQTHYSSRRQDDVDALAWPVFSQHALDLLRSAGEVLHPEPGELLWDAGDPYDLYLVLSGGVLLLDRREDRVVFVIEAGDFVGELGMLMGQRAFLPGVAMGGRRYFACGSRSCAGSWRSQGSSATSCSPRSTPGGAC
jgi:thioredoxin reductase (NADPH)